MTDDGKMKDVAEDFRQTVETYAPQLLALDEAAARLPRNGAEGWSAKQIVGHLIDSAANNHRRFVLAQFKDDLIFEGYAQEEWVRAQGYEEEPWAQIVELWRAYNLHLAHVMSRAEGEVSRRTRGAHSLDQIAFRTVDPKQPVTLEYLMTDYVVHLRHHLRQIFPEGAGLK